MQIPNYEILETIGEGGLAIVYKARKEKDSLLLAIKVPRVPYKDFLKELAVRLRLSNHSISILSNMIYTRLTTENGAYAFVVLAYRVIHLSDDYERALFGIKKVYAVDTRDIISSLVEKIEIIYTSNRLEILGRLGNFYSKPLSYYEINIPKLPFNGEMHGLFTLRDFEKLAYMRKKLRN